MRTLPKVTVLIFVVLFVSFVGAFLFRIHSYREIYIAHIAEVLGGHIEVGGRISLNILNFSLNASSVYVNRNDSNLVYKINNLEIFFSKKSLLYGKPKVSAITMSDGNITMNPEEIRSSLEHVQYPFFLENIELNVPDLLLKLNIANAECTSTVNGKMFQGKIRTLNNSGYSLSLKFNGQDHFTSNISSNVDNLLIEKKKKKFFIKGKGENLSRVLSALVPIFNDDISSDPFEINGQYNSNLEGEIEIKSKFIEGIVKTKKDSTGRKNNTRRSYLDLKKLDFTNVNLSELRSQKIKDFFDSSLSFAFLENDLTNGDLSKTDSLKSDVINFDIRNLTIGKFNIPSLKISFIHDKNRIKIESEAELSKSKFSSSGTIKGHYYPVLESQFSWKGVFSDDIADLASLFLKDIDIVKHSIGTDFSTSGNLILGKNMLVVSDLDLSLNDLKVQGSFSSKNFRRMSKKRSRLNITGISLNSMETIVKLKDILYATRRDTSFFRLNIKDMTLNGHLVELAFLKYNAMDDVHNSQFVFDSPNLSLSGRSNWNRNDSYFSLLVDGKNINFDMIDVIDPFDIDDGHDKSIEWNNSKIQDIKLPTKADVQIKFNRVFTNEIKNPLSFSFKSTIKRNIITIEEFLVKRESELFNLVSNITKDNEQYKILLSLIGHNVDLSRLMKNHLYVDYISGGINIEGKLSSSGSTIKELITHMKGKIDLSSNDITVTGGDIELLVKEVPKVKNLKELDGITKIKLFTGKSKLSSLSGASVIENGLVATSFTFVTQSTSNVLSCNFNLYDMQNASIGRIFFMMDPVKRNVANIDINIEGNIWKPKIFFNTKDIFSMLELQE